MLIKNAQETINENKTWGIVYSGDTTISDARYEADQMAKNTIYPTQKYFLDKDRIEACQS